MNQNPLPESPQFANYPRASFGPASRPPGVYFETIGEAWQIFNQDTGTWILSVLVAGLISVPLLAMSVYVSNGGSFMPQRVTNTVPGYMFKLSIRSILRSASSRALFKRPFMEAWCEWAPLPREG